MIRTFSIGLLNAETSIKQIPEERERFVNKINLGLNVAVADLDAAVFNGVYVLIRRLNDKHIGMMNLYHPYFVFPPGTNSDSIEVVVYNNSGHSLTVYFCAEYSDTMKNSFRKVN